MKKVAKRIIFVCLCSIILSACGTKIDNSSVVFNNTTATSGAIQETTEQKDTDPFAYINGKWRIVSTIGTGYIFSDSSPETDYLDGTLIIQEDYMEIKMPEKSLSCTIDNPKYIKTYQSRDDFFMERYANYDSFGFADEDRVPLLEVRKGSREWDVFGSRIWIKDKNHIVLAGPQYFLAERVDD